MRLIDDWMDEIIIAHRLQIKRLRKLITHHQKAILGMSHYKEGMKMLKELEDCAQGKHLKEATKPEGSP